jgi:hypothetical protein
MTESWHLRKCSGLEFDLVTSSHPALYPASTSLEHTRGSDLCDKLAVPVWIVVKARLLAWIS